MELKHLIPNMEKIFEQLEYLGEKKFDYKFEVEFINPLADTVATATFQGLILNGTIRQHYLKKSTRIQPPKPNHENNNKLI